jgi:hypothetical protein
MIVKNKTGKLSSQYEAAPKEPLEDVATSAPERRSPVTQVVEVIEEEEKAEVVNEAAETQKPQDILNSTQRVTQTEAVDDTVPVIAGDKKEMVDELFQKRSTYEPRVMPEISMHTKSSTKPVFIWAIIVIVACTVVGVSLFLLTGNRGVLPSIISLPTPTPTTTPVVTPTPATSGLLRDAVTVQVLNGGGVAGAASTMKTLLEEKGYTVSNTGNAESYTYDTTEILVKPSQSAYLQLLKEDLQASYTLGTVSATLSDSASYDIRIIVGKE